MNVPIGWALVAIQFALLGRLGEQVIRSRHRRAWSTILGIALGMLGGGVAGLASYDLREHLTAHPAPAEHAVLRATGIYGVVRHPIYTGLLLIGLGAVLIARTRRAAFALGALAALLNVKSRFEERMLLDRFPDYAVYARHVPRFIPR